MNRRGAHESLRLNSNPDELQRKAIEAFEQTFPSTRIPSDSRRIATTMASQRIPYPLVAARRYDLVGNTHVKCPDCGAITVVGSAELMAHAKGCQWSFEYQRMDIPDSDICPFCNRNNHKKYNTESCEGERRFTNEAFANLMAAVAAQGPSEDNLML